MGKSSGTGVVHLTGYNIQDDAGPGMMYESEDDSSDEETEKIPALTNGKKRKATSGDESAPAKKPNKEPVDKAKEEKKQAIEMAKKIASTIKKADEDDDSDDDDYEDVGEEEDG